MAAHVFHRLLLRRKAAPACQPLMDKAIVKHLCQTPAAGSNSKPGLANPEAYVCMGAYTAGKTEYTGFYLAKGARFGKLAVPPFVLTPSCQLNLRNIARAAAPQRYPILLQGPTSAGKNRYLKKPTAEEITDSE